MKSADPSRGRHARHRRAVERLGRRPGGLLDSLRAEVQGALRDEADAVGRLRDMRHRVADVIARAVMAGVPYDLLAIATLRARLGRAPTIQERIREAHRLRKRSSRFLVTAGHANHLGQGPESAPAVAPSVEHKEVQNMTAKLVKKTTTTIEEFAPDGVDAADEDLEGTDADLDGADDETDDADAASPIRRRRRA